FSVALSAIWRLISRTNKYIDETTPWVLAKDENKKERLGNVMAHLAESLRVVGILLKPFLTEAPEQVFTQLGISNQNITKWDDLHEIGIIKQGTKVIKGEPMFPRLDMKAEVNHIKKRNDRNEKGIIKQGTKIIKRESMFTKIDKKAEVNHKKELMNQSIIQPEEENLNIPIKEEIEFPDFTQLDLRVAKVIEAEK